MLHLQELFNNFYIWSNQFNSSYGHQCLKFCSNTALPSTSNNSKIYFFQQV